MREIRDSADLFSGNSIEPEDDFGDLGIFETRVKKMKSAEKRQTVYAQPKSIEEIAAILTDTNKYPSPVRPCGSGSSVTRCASTAEGTIVDMTALNKVIGVDADTVTVQAGILMRDLAENLAAGGMELVSGCAEPDRTVGGAVSSGSLSVGLPGSGRQLASSVCQIGMVRCDGRRVEISSKLPDLLVLARQSYGLLGIIHTVKLKIRPINAYQIKSRKFDFEAFEKALPGLVNTAGAMRASLMPFRDRVHAELRCPAEGSTRAAVLRWKLRDWAANAVLPSVVKSVNKVVPIGSLRDPLIDGVTDATQSLLGSGLTESGSNAAEQTGRFRVLTPPEDIVNCTWMFPADNFANVVPEFRRFCIGHHRATKFRCDLPAEMWGFDQDQSAMLSASYNGAVFALNVRSTREKGWDDFLLDFAEFATHFQAIPTFNQTKGFTAKYAAKIYAERLQRFRNLRLHFDPHDRLLNQFFAENIG